MDVSAFEIKRERVSLLRKVDLYGQYGTGKISFDHRDQTEPVGIYLSQLRIESISLWFLRTDNQNVALQGMATSFRRLNENNFFDPYVDCPESIRKSNQDYDIVNFETGEYIRAINLTIPVTNGKIGTLEFVTTKKGRKILAYGSSTNQEPLPPGQTHTFDFVKGEGEKFPGYVVGFYGEFDSNFITYLGVYIAPFTEINYYGRRGYILTYKKMQQSRELYDAIVKKLGLEREGDRFKDAAVEGSKHYTSKVLFYFLDSSLSHPELFKNVLEYL